MSTVLLTGFEPFAGDAVNPSWDAVSLVDVPPRVTLSGTPNVGFGQN
jgi:pyrrolidone-carboxylate peptidase